MKVLAYNKFVKDEGPDKSQSGRFNFSNPMKKLAAAAKGKKKVKRQLGPATWDLEASLDRAMKKEKTRGTR